MIRSTGHLKGQVSHHSKQAAHRPSVRLPDIWPTCTHIIASAERSTPSAELLSIATPAVIMRRADAGMAVSIQGSPMTPAKQLLAEDLYPETTEAAMG
mmetsp:Transcript_11592/g.33003  ORF Transcript_11592/g.33003 Transcript_11592/m.33003 type:complete len:98 (+) Transcript_11592:1234-1527(+)